MSGIFKGNSIYKSGGGGGGFKDGGQLVDGDFIKVENNTVSSYDNVSRDPVNFYFEVKDGEILNSVVELTTAVNATINVYVVKNGFYYLLGNVGGNTVNAGDDYKVNITGDSYAIEQVSAPPSIEYAEILDGVYKVKVINGLIWCMDILKSDLGLDVLNLPNTGSTPYDNYDNIYVGKNQGLYYYAWTKPGATNLINSKVYPWRIPTHSDLQNIGLITSTCSDCVSNFGLTRNGKYGAGAITPNQQYYYRINDNHFYLAANGEEITSNGSSDSQPPAIWGGGGMVSIHLIRNA